MRITDVEAIHLRLPVVREVADGTQDCLLVRVHTDSGVTGLGEVVSCSYVARSVLEAPRSAPFRHGLGAIVKGLDPLDVGSVWDAMIAGTGWYGPGGVVRHSMSGIDMALWDIRGKVEGRPVRRLLSDSPRDTIPCYASVLWPDRPELVADSARGFMEAGYRAVKYGWGPMGPDANLDQELVAAAREAVGPATDLMVDAGRAWSADVAIDRVELFRSYRPKWLEEPLRPDDVAGYRKLTGVSPIPIAAGEVSTLAEEFERLVTDGGVGIVQPDLGRVGGITGGSMIADLAEKHGAFAVPHAYGTGVLLAASAQWAAALAEPLAEYTRSDSPLARSLVRHTMEFRRGELCLSDAAGLGIELDESVVERFRV